MDTYMTGPKVSTDNIKMCLNTMGHIARIGKSTKREKKTLA
jgi:hypothetical protein